MIVASDSRDVMTHRETWYEIFTCETLFHLYLLSVCWSGWERVSCLCLWWETLQLWLQTTVCYCSVCPTPHTHRDDNMDNNMDNNASHQVEARDQTILHVESNVMLSTDVVLSIKSEGLTSPTPATHISLFSYSVFQLQVILSHVSQWQARIEISNV